jgi:hypothetical protein
MGYDSLYALLSDCRLNYEGTYGRLCVLCSSARAA